MDEKTLVLCPGGAKYAVLGAISIVIALCLTLPMATKHHLTCNRTPGQQAQCQLTQTLLGVEIEKESVQGLRSARLDRREQTDRNGNVYSNYQIILSTSGGPKPIGEESSNAQHLQSFVEEVNAFTQRQNLTQLDVSIGSESIFLWFCGIFILVGIGLIIMGVQTMFTTWTFDKTKNTFVQRSETLLGIKVKEYPLQDVFDVRLNPSPRGSGYYNFSRIELEFRDGSTLPATPWINTESGNKERAIAAIRAFLWPHKRRW